MASASHERGIRSGRKTVRYRNRTAPLRRQSRSRILWKRVPSAAATGNRNSLSLTVREARLLEPLPAVVLKNAAFADDERLERIRLALFKLLQQFGIKLLIDFPLMGWITIRLKRGDESA